MTLTELIAEVNILTNRPDLTARTLAAVRSSTMKFHSRHNLRKDLVETAVAFYTASSLQEIDTSADTPLVRFKNLKYIRGTDVTFGDGPILEVIDPVNYKDQYGYLRADVCYVAGTSIQIRFSQDRQYAIVGYYQRPQVGATDGTFSSWIALEFPWLIIYDAAATVCAGIGKAQEAGGFKSLAEEHWQGFLDAYATDMTSD
jgi:hypothetical protein